MRDGGADIANSSPALLRRTQWNRSSTLRGTMPTSTMPRQNSAADACTKLTCESGILISACSRRGSARTLVTINGVVAIRHGSSDHSQLGDQVGAIAGTGEPAVPGPLSENET